MDIKKKAGERLNALERVLHSIPGFKGYFGRELRRDSDRLQRDFIVKQLAKVKSGMNKAIQAAGRRKDLDLLGEHDRFVRELDRAIGACRYADQGYSGFFDLVKVREDELDRVYELDARIVEAALALRADFQARSTAGLAAAGLEPLRQGLARVEDLFEQRTALLRGQE